MSDRMPQNATKTVPWAHGLHQSPGDAGPSARGPGAAGGTSGPAAVPQHRRGAMAWMAWRAWSLWSLEDSADFHH